MASEASIDRVYIVVANGLDQCYDTYQTFWISRSPSIESKGIECTEEGVNASKPAVMISRNRGGLGKFTISRCPFVNGNSFYCGAGVTLCKYNKAALTTLAQKR